MAPVSTIFSMRCRTASPSSPWRAEWMRTTRAILLTIIERLMTIVQPLAMARVAPTPPLSQRESAASPADVARAVPRALQGILNLDDFERAAASFLPRRIFTFVSSGAEDCAALRGNRAAYADYSLVPRVLRDVSVRNQAVELFGQRYASPFGIPPL